MQRHESPDGRAGRTGLNLEAAAQLSEPLLHPAKPYARSTPPILDALQFIRRNSVSHILYFEANKLRLAC